ncbi:MAG: CHAT domain-containing protein, partial [Chloroflexi bacterium]|nr:CHAT domain-containing protein [Chloroflexota bacterium]
MELTLTQRSEQVLVQVDGADSHSFAAAEIVLKRDDPLAAYDPQPYGQRLYRALFAPDSLAARAWADSAATPATHALLLVIPDAALQRVPWEYLYDGQAYLALAAPLTRGLPAAQRVAFNANAHAAGNVLVVASDPLLYPNGAPVVALNVARERANVRAAFDKANAAFHVTFVKPPTRDELHKALTRVAPPAILHFLGHGTATPQGAQLLFEDALAQGHSVDAAQVIAPARDKLFMVYFNSCETAMALDASASNDSTASNLAYSLARAGVPYALGMQLEVPEIAALRFSEFLYLHLAQGETVERALWQARRALWDDENLMRTALSDGGTIDLRAFCLGIPVLYTALASPTGIRVAAGAAEIFQVAPRREFDPRIPPPQVFRGRSRELVAIGRLL